jgi:hypothetical protein
MALTGRGRGGPEGEKKGAGLLRLIDLEEACDGVEPKLTYDNIPVRDDPATRLSAFYASLPPTSLQFGCLYNP